MRPVAAAVEKREAWKANLDVHLSRNRMLYDDPEKEWRAILGFLEKYTPVPRLQEDYERASIMIPEDILLRMMHDNGQNIWDVATEHNCHVMLSNPNQSVDGKRPLIIEGPKLSVLKATSRIEHLAHRLLGERLLEHPTTGPESMKLCVTDICRRVYTLSRSNSPRLVDTITIPEVWTRESFARCVHEICSTRISRPVGEALHQSTGRQRQMVGRALIQLFSDTELVDFMSTHAFNEALQYLQQHNQMAATRDLFYLMYNSSLSMNAKTLNILLAPPAREHNLTLFRYLLQRMIERGVDPTADSWVLFIMITPLHEDKMFLASSMKRRGLLVHPRTVKAVVAQLISTQFGQWLDSGKDQLEFLSSMDGVWGTEWASTSAANRMLYELTRRSLKVETEVMWESLSRRGVVLDTVSLNTILTLCADDSNPSMAVHTVWLAHLKKISPDETTYIILLKLAWRCRLYNFSRVTWRYACMTGHAGRRLQERVYRSFVSAHFDIPDDKSKTWATTAGRVLVGLNSPEPLPQGLNKYEFKDEADLMKNLSVWLDDPKQRDEAVALGKRMILRDVRSFQWLRPAQPLWTILKRALNMDIAWADSGVHIGQSSEWKQRNAITVPLMNSRHWRRQSKIRKTSS